MERNPQTLHDVFRAATLSFLIACLYLLLSAAVDYVAIHALETGDTRFQPEANFRMALGTASLLASLLCVWVLLVSAFARKYISRLKPGTTFVAAISVAAPLVVSGRLLALIDPQSLWPPILSLLFALLWSSLGLHTLLWYLTSDHTASSNTD